MIGSRAELLRLMEGAAPHLRAWTADALARHGGREEKTCGETLVADLLSPAIEHHEDYSSLVGALLVHDRYSPASDRWAVLRKLPPVPLATGESSSFFDSVVFIYLLARSLGPSSDRGVSLTSLLSSSSEKGRDRGHSLYADLMRLGALIELDPSALSTNGYPELVRVPAPDRLSHLEQVTVQWFLGMYGPGRVGDSESQLMSALRSLIGGPVEPTGASSPEEAVLLLELSLIQRPAYRVVSDQDFREAIRKKAGWRLWIGGLVTAGAFVLLLWVGLASRLEAATGKPVTTYFALASVAFPGGLSILHTFLSSRWRVYGWTLAAGIVYSATLLVAGLLMDDPDVVSTVSSGLMIGILFGAFRQDWRALRE